MAAEAGLWGLVPPDLRELLRLRTLAVRRPTGGRRPGRHAARRAGVGADFWDQRAYTPGDDPRSIDWRAVARRDRLVVQRHESQEDLRVVIALDQGGNMAYGEGDRSKRSVATGLSAGLLALAAGQGDRVGLVRGLDDTVDASLVTAARGAERLSALETVLRAPGGGRCPWDQMLDALAGRLASATVLIVVSDFLDGWDSGGTDPPGPSLVRGCGLLRARGHDLLLVQVVHRDELEFPFDSDRLLRFEDLRSGADPVEGPGSRMREAYLDRLNAHQRWLHTQCEAEGLSRILVPTHAPPADAFLRLLQRLAGIPVESVPEAPP